MEAFFSTLLWGWPMLVALLCLAVTTWLVYRVFRVPEDTFEVEEPERTSQTWDRLKSKWQYFVARYGYLPQDPLTQSFLKALESMQELIGEEQSHYQLPWFMLLGVEGSGKSSLLQGIHLKRLLTPSSEQETPTCAWNFYDHGIVLDVKGDLIVSENDLYSDEQSWRLLLDLLSNHRPKRPLDGIVLTISAEELLGKMPVELLMRRADRLYMKLWEMQRILGIRLPIYILITKCDLVAGFSSFCQEIPEANQQDMLGWSNPHAIDTAFSPLWIEELFEEVGSRITRLQQEIFAQGQIYDERDGVFVFPREFRSLQKYLRTYLEHVFKDSLYHESFFLRGVYFCGSPDDALETNFEAMVEQNLEQQSNLFEFSHVPQEPSLWRVTTRTLFFATNLFKDKIFPEKGIVLPTRRHFFLQNHSIRLLQMFGVVGVALGIYGLIDAYDELRESRSALLPHLNRIKAIVKRALEDKERIVLDHVFFEQQASIILNTLAGLKVTHLQNWLIPPSWLSPLERKMEKVIILSYDKIIFRALSQKLREQVRLAVEGRLGVASHTLREPPTERRMAPLELPEFLDLQTYVSRLHMLQQIAIKLENLPNSGNVKDLALVVQKLFQTTLPEDFYNNSQIYQQAIAAASFIPLSFEEYVQPATQRLGLLSRRFIDTAFDPERMSPDLANLVQDLRRFTHLEMSKYSVEELKAFNTHISNVMTMLNHPDSFWVSRENFDPGPAFHEMVRKIASSYFFGQSAADTLSQESNLAFQEFKTLLATYRSPPTGQVFSLSESESSFSSDPLINLHGLLNLLFSEPFMVSAKPRPLRSDIPSGTYLAWNFQQLHEVEGLLDHFDFFITNKLLFFPKNFWETLQLISLSSLKKNLQANFGKAQTFLPTSRRVPGLLSPEEALLPEIQNLRAVAPLLGSSIGRIRALGLTQLYAEVKKIVFKQALGLLRTLDQILESESPYSLQSALVDGDAIEDADLKQYLALQRERIRYLAKEFAEPVVQLLQTLFSLDRSQPPSLYQKWSGILVQLNLYAKNTSGNSVSVLEKFVLKEVAKGETGCADGEASKKLPASDFFLQKLAELKKRLAQNCDSTDKASSNGAYREISSHFNANLAGRFPFVASESPDSPSPDASIAALRTFYDLLEENGEPARRALEKLDTLGSQRAIVFLDTMEALKAVFQSVLTGGGEGSISTKFQATFRGYTDQEANGNQIISCQLKIGDRFYDLSKKTMLVQWAYAQPIEMQFRWASGSRIRPTASQIPVNLNSCGLEASFQYAGNWALLRMLRQHACAASLQATRKRLRFEIPCTQVQGVEVASTGTVSCAPTQASSCGTKALQTVLFMDLNLVKPTKPEGEEEQAEAKSPSLEALQFPSHAPSVSFR